MSETDLPDEERRKIKVTDRRLFDSDGNLRDTASPPPHDPRTEPPGADVSTPATPGDDLPEPADGTDDDKPSEIEQVAGTDTDTGDDAPQDAVPRLQLDDQALLKFIEEQYVGGLLALGAMPEPQSGQMVEDLDMARLRVEILALLQENTEGGRTDDTSKALEDVLYQLRMAYLQKRKVAKL